MSVRLSASLASAPLAHLGDAVMEVEASGVDLIHVDIEDGSFVPMMTLGIKVIGDVRPLTQLPLDVHLMMVSPEWIIPQIAAMGANRISVHWEACPYPRRVLKIIHDLGISAGLAFNPATPLPDLKYLQPYLSFVLLLTSEPEVDASPFLPEVLDKVQQGKQQSLPHVEWVVDGGINPDNIKLVTGAGVDTIVMGRAIFAGGLIKDNLTRIRAVL